MGLVRRMSRTAVDGRFELYAVALLLPPDGCWVLRALGPGEVVLDSVILEGAELPFGVRAPPDTVRIDLVLGP
jgi:hypothetical protein